MLNISLPSTKSKRQRPRGIGSVMVAPPRSMAYGAFYCRTPTGTLVIGIKIARILVDPVYLIET